MVPFRERNEDLQRSDEDLQRGSEINSDEVISLNYFEVFAHCAACAEEGSRAAPRSPRLSTTPSRPPMASSSGRLPPVVYDSDDEVVTTLTADERAAVERVARQRWASQAHR